MFALDGDIGGANVVTELVLSGIALEEAVEIDVSTMEAGSVILRFQSADADAVPPALLTKQRFQGFRGLTFLGDTPGNLCHRLTG